MPQSLKDIWNRFTSWPNLLRAYHKCRKRKRYKSGACEFDFQWESNLLLLQNELVSQSWIPGEYHNFWIKEPKRRKISAAPFRDRVVHHAIVNLLEPFWDPQFIYDSYACRRGKGTHRAIRRGQHFARSYEYCVRSDVVKFFPNIDHEILLNILRRKISDKLFFDVIIRVIESGKHILADEASREYFCGDDLFSITRNKGLPIGNLTSQFFANVYLNELDHFVKHSLRMKGYIRYADDFILFGNSKCELWNAIDAIKSFLAGLRLRLHRHKTILCKCDSGFKFLGFKVNEESRRLSQDALRRFNRNLRTLKWQYQNRLISARDVGRSLDSWLAYSEFANSTGIKKELWKRVVFSRSNE